LEYFMSAFSLALISCLFADPAPQHGLRVPDGFEVTEVADSSLANDIYCLTVDPEGRVVVSGRGYIRILVEDSATGKAGRVLEFTAAPKDGAMGLFWEGRDLYCMGDGGLRVYRDAAGEGRQRPSQLLFALQTGGEHASHAIRRGPDGWLYVLCGNNTGIKASHATLPTSPIKDPVAGCVLRFPPDFKGCEIVADGFRNAYAMDFNSAGELFTFDSDNERCVSLPWYEPTRCYHIIPGGHYGWQSPQHAVSWRQPPYFLDVVAPLATLGRGSPTGVVCYKHTQFPSRYRDGLFLCDWTFGRIYFVALKAAGSSYRGETEVYLRSTGDNGFAPTAAAVHPRTGDLYVSIGGRGTRGAVYRIRYTAGLAGVKPEEVARLQPAPRSLEWKPGLGEQLVRQARGEDRAERLRALALLERHMGQAIEPALFEEAFKANWDEPDRYLRRIAARLVPRLPGKTSTLLGWHLANYTPRQRVTVGSVFGLGRPDDRPWRIPDQVWLLFDSKVSTETKLEVLRLLQLDLGDLGAAETKGTIWEGYTLRKKEASRHPRFAIPLWLERAFPSGNADLDRELSRILALCEDDDPGRLERVAARITEASDPVDDLHYLIVLARLKAPRPEQVTARTATALLALDRKLTQRKLNRDTHWPLRVAEMYAELVRKDPALPKALLAHPDLGRPDHALFMKAPGIDRVKAADIFLARAARDPEYAWNADLVALIGDMPPERSLPVLRRLWGQHGLDEAVLPYLARRPAAEDRGRLAQGLTSLQPGTVRLCLEALQKLPASQADEVLPILQAFRQLPSSKEYDPLRPLFDAVLEQAMGQSLKGWPAWKKWYLGKHPEQAAKLSDGDGVDVAAWNKRLAAMDWSTGDSGRGRQVFVRASCAACHSGSQALGPDLQGVAGRFSRDDLFTAILQPSRDVPPRYRTTQVVTAEGKVYQGLVVYEAVDSLILQTGPALTLRLTNQQISERRISPISLMPTGLLDKLADMDIADLYAYLKGLGGPK
jgi:putative heme-binding domain-containing protein